MYKQIIEEICNELDIKYTYLSNNWIIKLEKNNIIKYLAWNKFDLNSYVVGKIMDDKYAFYDVLKNLNIPVCIHNIFYNKNNSNDFALNYNTKESIINCFNKYNNDVIVKPNLGSQGIGVNHITNEKELLKATEDLFKTNYSISICPFYNIKNEYRVIVLDNKIKLIFKKINPKVLGDGKSSLKELLIKFNKNYFKNIEVPNIILNKDEIYTYDFHFNLSKGSIASLEIEPVLKEKIKALALEVSKKVGITFASIDIIETINDQLLVLEANSGVTINKVIEFIPNGYNIAKNIYKEAITKMFNNY